MDWIISSDPTGLVMACLTVVFTARLFYRARNPTLHGPPGLPIVGNALQFGHLAHNHLAMWAGEYGDIYFLKMGNVTWTVLSSAEAINEVIVKKGAISASRPNQYVAGEIFCNGSRGVIFAPHGKQWQKNRQVFSKVLTKQMVIRYAPIVESAAAQFCLNLLRFSEEAKEAGIHSSIYTEHYTLNALIGSMFGEQRDTLNDPNYRAMLEANTETIRRINPNGFIMDFLPFLRPFYPGTAKIVEVREAYKRTVLAMISQHRERMADPAIDVRPCMARTIIEAMDADEYDEIEVITLFGNIISAGIDTTASALNWLTIYLVQYPEVQVKMQEEIDRVVGRHRLPTEADLKDLVYIRRVLRESSRMQYPLPLSVFHMNTEPIHYRGHVIPKDSWIVSNTLPMQYDAERYPEPHTFNPDRWMHEERSLCDESMGPQDQRENWMFGTGRRICVGMHLAEQEFHLAVAMIAWSCTISLGKDEVIIEHEAEPGLVIQPKSRRFCYTPRTLDVDARLALHTAQAAVAT